MEPMSGTVRVVSGSSPEWFTLAHSVDADGVRVRGYASVYGVLDWYSSILTPGAIDQEGLRYLEEHGVLLYQHDPDKPLGRIEVARSTDVGLWVEGTVVDTPYSAEVVPLLRKGLVTGLSVGFVPIETVELNDRTLTDLGIQLSERDRKRIRPWSRIFTRVQVLEVSLVTIPANPKAWVKNGLHVHVPDVASHPSPESAVWRMRWRLAHKTLLEVMKRVSDAR